MEQNATTAPATFAVSLQSDIVGRVKRLGLKPSEKTALLPLQEALSNALHAIDDQHKLSASEYGIITVELIYIEGQSYRSLDGFLVTDNGIGLGPVQFEAFCKPDTIHKITRGGKGVGRLVWLKTFNLISIRSNYSSSTKVSSRCFDFVLDDCNQIRNMRESEGVEAKPGTVVSLSGFDPLYASRCPVKADGIAKHLVSHFMPVFAAGTAPSISLIVDGVKQDLNAFFRDSVVDQKDSSFYVDYDGEQIEIKIRHINAISRSVGRKILIICFCARMEEA